MKNREMTVPLTSSAATIRVIIASRGRSFWMKQTDSEEEALQQLQKHAANYAQRITIYKIDGRTVKREVAEYDQWEKKWMS